MDRRTEILRHMLGMDGREPGYRNHFAADPGGPDDVQLRAMEDSGLVHFGLHYPGQLNLYHATAAGCRLVGLPEPRITEILS